MSTRSWAFSNDLSTSAVVAVGVLVALSIALLLVELRRRERLGGVIAASGILGTLLLAIAVLRPVRVTTKGSVVGPRVVVLVDQSRRLLLEDNGRTRRQRAIDAVKQVRRHFADARLSVLGFGDGAPTPFDAAETKHAGKPKLTFRQRPGRGALQSCPFGGRAPRGRGRHQRRAVDATRCRCRRRSAAASCRAAPRAD